MKHISVLVLPSVKNIKNAANTVPEATITAGTFKKLIITLDSAPSIRYDGQDIESFDAVWLSSFWRTRALAYAVKQYLDDRKVPSTWVEPASSKLSDQMTFCLAGLPMPKTFFCSSHDANTFIDELEEYCGYPCVIKDNKGSRGAQSILVYSREEFLLAWKDLPKHKYYHIQEFIPNDFDWGIMVVNGQVVSGEKSYHSPEDFRNNACNGAEETFINVNDIPNNIKKLAIQASSSLGLSWSRADILINKNTGEGFLLEVNRSPGITEGSTEEKGSQKFFTDFCESLAKV